MQQRPLGNTGMMVSALGYGTFKLGRNRQHRFAADYTLPTEAEAARLLSSVLDAGITLIDTAPAYGLSEERIGRTIRHRREEFVLATKVGEQFTGAGSVFDFSAAAIRASISRSLARLRTDRLDLVCVHSDGSDLLVQSETDVVPTLLECKDRGDLVAAGFSAKTVEGARAAMDWADVIMVPFHRNDTSFAGVIDEAARAGVGVIVKKGLDSGSLSPARGIPFVLNHPGVSSLLIGSLNAAHIQENIGIAERV